MYEFVFVGCEAAWNCASSDVNLYTIISCCSFTFPSDRVCVIICFVFPRSNWRQMSAWKGKFSNFKRLFEPPSVVSNLLLSVMKLRNIALLMIPHIMYKHYFLTSTFQVLSCECCSILSGSTSNITTFSRKETIRTPSTLLNGKKIPPNLRMGIFSMIN